MRAYVDEPDIPIWRRRDQMDRVDNRWLAQLVADGSWIRITAGSYAVASDWWSLTPMERHRARVVEVSRRMHRPAVLSHFAAAAIEGIDILGPWPAMVDVIADITPGGRSHGAIRRHAQGREDAETAPFGRHLVTTPRQTAIDLARVLPLTQAVASMDQAIQAARVGGPLTSRSDILDLLDRTPFHRGDARARRAAEFANPLAANVRESQSRFVVAELGFPAPRLQERRVLPSGRVVHGDFYWPEHDHWGELDGRGKYLSPEFGSDRDAADIVIDEKNRENEIRREVLGFSRWEPADADQPRRLYDILTGDGLPSRRPRP